MSTSTPTTTAERRRNVFLAARTIFSGQKAFIRDRNAVEKLISRHEWSFRNEVLHLGKQSVIDITLSLLRKQVFESEAKAKIVFPELFQVSAARSLQHDISEINAARSEAKAQEEVSRSEDALYELDGVDEEEEYLEETPRIERTLTTTESSPSTLFPAYLSYAVQHKLLNAVQKLLEECCYDFTRRWIPGLLTKREWDCAEAVEITRWSEVLPSKFFDLDTDATSLESRSKLFEALKAISPLRNAAVHRQRTSGRGIEQMLDNALYLVQVLQDGSRTSKMEAISENFRARRKDMEIHKINLENQLDQQLQDIQEQRAALDRKAQEAKENMVMQDIENTKSISSHFERSIANLTIDHGEVEPIDGECHEIEQDACDNDMDPSNDVEPLQANRLEAELGVVDHEETADGYIEYTNGRSDEIEPDATEQVEEFGDDFHPMQHEAEPDLSEPSRDADGGSEPMINETERGALNNDDSGGNGGHEEIDQDALRHGNHTGSDIEDMNLEDHETENRVSW